MGDKKFTNFVEDSTNQEETTVIFVAYITTKDGKRIYARQRGKKAFPIRVKVKPSEKAN